MEIIPGVHLVNGVRGANCYLVMTGDRLVLIDTGMPGNARKIINYVQGLGKKPSDVEYIVITHADIDHTGSAAELKKITGAKLAIHSGDAAMLSGKQGLKTARGALGVILKVMVRMMRFHPVEPDVLLKADSKLPGLQVIYTPGHTHGSISFYQPGKVIFVGDALRSDKEGRPKPPSRRFSADVMQAKLSLIAVSALEFEVMLPGHGAPVTGNAAGKVKELIKLLH
jgi:hydroxyacylglutathione hydrolase